MIGNIFKMRRLYMVAAVSLIAVSATAGSAVDASAADLDGQFIGGANVVRANAEVGLIKAGLDRAAYQGCGCDGTNGKKKTSEVASLKVGDDGDVVTLGAMKASARTDRDETSASVDTSSEVAGVNLLDGLITADAIVGRAELDVTETTMTYTFANSMLVNLVVGGVPIDPSVGENTEIPLVGIGKVVIKSVKESGNFTTKKGEVQIDMLRVEINQANIFDIPVGAVIIIARATAGYSRTGVDNVIDGVAYLALANAEVGETLQNKIGKPGLLGIGCDGTKNGKKKTKNVAEIDGETILEVAAGQTSGKGGPTDTGAAVTMKAKLGAISLLGGAVTADAIHVVSISQVKDGNPKRSSKGTEVLGLKIGGLLVGDITAKNVSLNVPLVGTVYLNEVKKPPKNSGRSQKVTGLRLEVDVLGALLPVGAEVVVGYAESKAY